MSCVRFLLPPTVHLHSLTDASQEEWERGEGGQEKKEGGMIATSIWAAFELSMTNRTYNFIGPLRQQ